MSVCIQKSGTAGVEYRLQYFNIETQNLFSHLFPSCKWFMEETSTGQEDLTEESPQDGRVWFKGWGLRYVTRKSSAIFCSLSLSRWWTAGRIKAVLKRVYLLRPDRKICPSHPPFTGLPSLTQQRPLTQGSLTHTSSTRNLERFMKVGVSESHIKQGYMNNSWSPAKRYIEAKMIWHDFIFWGWKASQK